MLKRARPRNKRLLYVAVMDEPVGDGLLEIGVFHDGDRPKPLLQPTFQLRDPLGRLLVILLAWIG